MAWNGIILSGHELTEGERERFWAMVDKTPGHGPNGDCWVWTGKLWQGYGNISFRGRAYRVHRLAWEMANGKPLGELQARHECDHRCCVRHIISGTNYDNVLDMWKRGRASGIPGRNSRKTHCKRGHPLEGHNLLPCFLRIGKRVCRECSRLYCKQRRAEAKAAREALQNKRTA